MVSASLLQVQLFNTRLIKQSAKAWQGLPCWFAQGANFPVWLLMGFAWFCRDFCFCQAVHKERADRVLCLAMGAPDGGATHDAHDVHEAWPEESSLLENEMHGSPHAKSSMFLCTRPARCTRLLTQTSRCGSGCFGARHSRKKRAGVVVRCSFFFGKGLRQPLVASRVLS